MCRIFRKCGLISFFRYCESYHFLNALKFSELIISRNTTSHAKFGVKMSLRSVFREKIGIFITYLENLHKVSFPQFSNMKRVLSFSEFLEIFRADYQYEYDITCQIWGENVASFTFQGENWYFYYVFGKSAQSQLSSVFQYEKSLIIF